LKFRVLLVFIFISFSSLFAQKEGDRILAVVGNDIILESDFQYQLQLYARQNQLTEINPLIAQQIFQQLLTDKIIYAKAEQDSVSVTEDEINKELEFRIKSLTEQFGTEKKIEEVYGMSLGKIKLTLKEDLQKKLKSDKLKRKKFAVAMKVSDKEVREFFKNYRDSIPNASEELEISHIYLLRKVSDAEKKTAREKALLILDSIKSGVDFSELAKRNSDDKQSAVNGGDLGFAKRGMFVKEFEETLWLLKSGEVSGLVETEFGYHIIKQTEKKGDQVKSQHILISYPKLESSDLETINFLKDLKSKIENGKISFEDAAKEYSQDPETNKKDGYIGIVPAERLDSNVVDALNNIPEGGITDPQRVGDKRSYGYEIIKLKKKSPSHELTLSGDYDRIKRYAEVFKENKEMEKWINELRESVFVDVKF